MTSSLRIADLLSDGMTALRKAGVELPAGEATAAAGRGCKYSPPAIMIGFSGAQRGSPAADAYRALLARRVDREPMSHILGRREFWSLPFFVTRDVLDPRPDSEALIDAVLDEALRPAGPVAHSGSRGWLRLPAADAAAGIAERARAGAWMSALRPWRSRERNAAALGLELAAACNIAARGRGTPRLTPADPADLRYHRQQPALYPNPRDRDAGTGSGAL